QRVGVALGDPPLRRADRPGPRRRVLRRRLAREHGHAGPDRRRGADRALLAPPRGAAGPPLVDRAPPRPGRGGAAAGHRRGGAAAIAAALGVSHPLLAAVIIVPALDLATAIPLTPGNIGIATGTVAVALQSKGVDLTKALTTGIALQAIETAVSIVVGAGGALFLARFGSAQTRRRTLTAAGA